MKQAERSYGKGVGDFQGIVRKRRSRCGNVPLQVPPLILLQYSLGWRNGGVTQSNKQYKAVTVICCDRFLRLRAASSSAFNAVAV